MFYSLRILMAMGIFKTLIFFAMFVCSVMQMSAVTVESELLFVLFFELRAKY